MIEFEYGEGPIKTIERCERAEISGDIIRLYNGSDKHYGLISLIDQTVVVTDTILGEFKKAMELPISPTLYQSEMTGKDIQIAELKGELKACKETIDKLIKSVL